MVLFLMKFFDRADFEILISLNMNLDSLVKNLSFSGSRLYSVNFYNCCFKVRLPIFIFVTLNKDLEKLRSSWLI
jgi:hypothetical protein